MNLPEDYYKKSLYPLQDGVIQIIRSSDTPFYLTGGTALSRGYFNHRYSDDLDLFINDSEEFLASASSIINNLSSEFQIEKEIETHDYIKFYIVERNIKLKMDLVNDIGVHYGDFKVDTVLGKMDSLVNILCNKITALFRYEPKDIVDIYTISKNYGFNWRNILSMAREKEAGVQPILAAEIIAEIPVSAMESVRWINKPDMEYVKKELRIIANDILLGQDNTIGESKPLLD